MIIAWCYHMDFSNHVFPFRFKAITTKLYMLLRNYKVPFINHLIPPGSPHSTCSWHIHIFFVIEIGVVGGDFTCSWHYKSLIIVTFLWLVINNKRLLSSNSLVSQRSTKKEKRTKISFASIIALTDSSPGEISVYMEGLKTTLFAFCTRWRLNASPTLV